MRASLLCCCASTVLLLVLQLLLLVSSSAAAAASSSLPAFLRLPLDETDDAPVDASSIHALLVVGSSGYGNYRHQADVMHSYHVLTSHGVPASQILTLSFDDAASSPFNPRQGTLINSPDGNDVRAGVPLDYSGEEVNAETFLAVLLGDSEKVAKIAPNGTGRVLSSTSKDRVFVFYSDHGAPGLLGMPTGPPLYADQLVGALLNMTRRRDDAEEEEREEDEGAEGAFFSSHRRHRHHQKKKRENKEMLPGNATFSEIVLFVEACEAGSMFEGLLPSSASSSDDDDKSATGEGKFSSSSLFRRHHRFHRFHRDDGAGIFALTAANPHESSWGVFCPGMPDSSSPAPPEGFDTCLGDLFAVSWMRAAEDASAEPAESLEELARVVAEATSRNGTFEMGSHVSEYGDRREEEQERAAAFLGVATEGGEEDNVGTAAALRGSGGEQRRRQGKGEASSSPSASLLSSAVPQREADLLHLRLAAAAAASRGGKLAAAAREALGRELRHREAVDGAAAAVAAVLLLGGEGGGGRKSDGSSTAPFSPSSSAEQVSRRLSGELSELHGISKEAAAAAAGPSETAAARAVAALVEAPLLREGKAGRPPAPAPPVVDDWECLRAGVAAFRESPGCSAPPSEASSSSSSSQYALRHSRLVARACNAGVAAEEISGMVAEACAGAGEGAVPVA